MIEIKAKGIKEAAESFERISQKLSSLPHLTEEKRIVEDSKFVEPIMEQGVRLSDTNEEARHEARYQAAKSGQPFDESKTVQEEIDKAEDELVSRYVRDYIENLLK